MKKIKLISLLVFVSILSIIVNAQSLAGPESVVFDQANNRYLISNSNGTSILARDLQGNLTTFVDQGLFFPRGLQIVGNTIYVTDIGKLVGYDLTTKALVVDSIIEDAQGLNDIAYDGKGNLFLSDDLLNKVFLFNVTYGTSTTLIKNGLSAPNGLLWDEATENLIICSFDGSNASIWKYDINTFILKTAVATTLSYLDGLAMDEDKNIYVSSWGDNSVHKFSHDFSTGPEVFSSGHDGPADIYINPTNNTLVVPNMNSNTLEFIKIIPASVSKTTADHGIEVSYSNEQPGIHVRINNLNATQLKVELIDGMARTNKVLIDKKVSAGPFELNLNRADLGIQSGIYILRIYRDGVPVAKRLVFR